jgi:hypothetical protein
MTAVTSSIASTFRIVADYTHSPLGLGWSAQVEALLTDDDIRGATATGATLTACQQHVMRLVAALSNDAGRPARAWVLRPGGYPRGRFGASRG